MWHPCDQLKVLNLQMKACNIMPDEYAKAIYFLIRVSWPAVQTDGHYLFCNQLLLVDLSFSAFLFSCILPRIIRSVLSLSPSPFLPGN